MSRTFDSFMSEPLDEAPVKVASSFGKPRRSFDSFMEEPLDIPLPRKKQNWFEEAAGNATNAAADLVGGVTQNVKKMGLPTDQFFDSARKARAQQQALDPVSGLTARLVAGGAGALGVGDTLANMVSGPVQQLFRVPPEKRAVSRMKEGFVATPAVQSVRKQAPEFFDQYADTAQNVLPVPGKAGEVVAGAAGVLHKVGKNSKAALAAEALAKRMGATGARRMADAILSQAAVGGGQVISDQMKANEMLDPGRIGIGAAVGGLAGGLAGGLEELAGGLATRMSRRPPVAVLPEAAPAQSVDMGSRLQAMIDSGHIDPNDADFAELVRAAQSQPVVVRPQGDVPLTPQQEQAAAYRQMAQGQRVAAPELPPAPLVPPRKKVQPAEPVMTLEEFKRLRAAERAPSKPYIEKYNQDYLDLSQEPPQPFIEKYNQDYLDLSPMALEPKPKTRMTADMSYAGGLEQIRTATPDTILEAIKQARKSIPAGTPVSIRKERLKQIQDMAEIAYNRHLTEREARTPQEIPSEELKERVQESPKAEADEAANELLNRNAQAAPPEPPVEIRKDDPLGAVRDMKIVADDGHHALGRDVVQYADSSTIQDPQLRGVVEDVAKAKINLMDAEHAFRRFSEQLYEVFGEAKLGKYSLSKPKDTVELNYAGQTKSNELRDELADGTATLTKGHFESTTDVDAADFSTVPPVSQVKTVSEAEQMLAVLQQRKVQAEKYYDDVRALLPVAGADHELSHQVMIDVNGHQIPVKVNYSKPKVARTFLAEEFATAKKANPSLTAEAFYGPYFEQEAARLGTDVGSIHDWIASLQRRAEGYRKAVADMLQDPAYSRTIKRNPYYKGLGGTGSQVLAEKAAKNGIKLPPLAVATRSGLVVGGMGLMSENSANAEDGSESEADPIFRNVGKLMLAAGLGGGMIRRLLRSRAGKQVIMFADTLDHISRIDTKLGLQGAKRLDNIILEGQAKAAQMGWGVHFPSQNEKARALTELADGTVPLVNALSNPPTGSALHGMNPEQRQAVVGYFAARKTLGKKIGGYAEAVDAAVAKNPDLEAEIGKESILRLHNLALDMTRMRPKQADMARRLAYATSSTMDFYFMMNPKHHLLNLTDSIIGGSARLGPGRMAKAWADMLEPDMQRIFKDANLFGSFKEDRNALGAMAGKKTGHIGEKVEDIFKSDEFNANRVALAGFNQFYDMNKAALPGYSNYKQFTKDVIQNQGKIPQAMRDAAWAHMLENQMRILGVDPLRANPNWVKNSLGDYGQLISFVNQPIRMARQIHEMLNKNQFDKLAVFMVAVTALGGEAVIPASLQFLGDQLAPEQMSKAKRIANAMSIPGAITNAVPEAGSYVPSLSSKLQYDPMAPYLFGTTGIAGEGVRTGFTKAVNAAKAIDSGNPEQMAKGGYEVAKQAGTVLAAGLPVGEGFRVAEAANKSMEGKGPIYNFDSFNPDPKAKALSPKYELNYDNTASGRMYPLLESLLPGELENTYRYKRSAAERQRFKGPDAQYAFENPFGR